MSSEAIVILVIVVLAVVGLIYLERNSRRNSKDGEELKVKSEE